MHYPAVPCPDGVCPLDFGTPIDTDISGDVSGVDLAVHPSVVIHGRVTDVDTHLPIAGALVDDTWYFRPDFNEAPLMPVVHETHSDADGNYAVYAPVAPPVYLGASGMTHVPTCAGESSCVGWLTNAQTRVGDMIPVDIALQLGGSFSGKVRDASGHETGALLSIFDSNGFMLYSFGDDRTAYGPIDGAYRSPVLPAGTYYAKARSDLVPEWITGACQVYAARRCQNSNTGEALLDVAPTPLVIVAGERRIDVDFTLVLDGVFADGFEQLF